jgi:hypothetical protein
MPSNFYLRAEGRNSKWSFYVELCPAPIRPIIPESEAEVANSDRFEGAKNGQGEIIVGSHEIKISRKSPGASSPKFSECRSTLEYQPPFEKPQLVKVIEGAVSRSQRNTFIWRLS